MEKESYQKELFEFKPPKKQRAGFGQLFQKTDFSIMLTAEKIVFIGIGIIMLFVISFALGVERGKSLSGKVYQAEPIKQAVVPQVQPTVPTAIKPQDKTIAPSTNVTPVRTKQAVAVPKTVIEDKNKPYTIVAAAFSRQDFALSEVNRLKKAGIEAFVYYSDPYYLACVGAFANKDSALKSIGKIRQMHRDAYIRLK